MNKKLYVLSLVSTTFFLYVVSEHKVRSALLMNIIRRKDGWYKRRIQAIK
jgi:hypothetical protein